jgi:hypothetical protein
VTRARIGRWWTSVSVTVLLASQVFAGTASAATTRFIYVGYDARALDTSVASSDLVGNDQLAFTPVTAGGTSASSIYVRNVDNQTLTHVVITIQRTQGNLTVSGVFGGDSGKCLVTATAVTCDFGNLKQGATASFTLLVGASTIGLAQELDAQIQFNESTNPKGGNPQIEFAEGLLDVADGGCDAVATFLPPGQADKLVGTGCTLSSSNPQITSVLVPATVVSAIRVADEAPRPCPTGLTCFGEDSVADIAIDTTATVTWTITWLVPANFNIQKLGVIHYKDDGSLDFAITYKKDTCKGSATGCFVLASLNGTTLTAVIKTSGNGAMKGFN